MLNEIIDSLYSNDNFEINGTIKTFTSNKYNKVEVFCPAYYSKDKRTVFHIPVDTEFSNKIETINYIDIPYGDNKVKFSELNNNNKNKIYGITVLNMEILLNKLKAFCSFLKYVDEQISDSSNFHYKLKIFQLFNNHKNNSEDYKFFEKEIFNSIAENTYKLTVTEKYIDVNDKECDNNSEYIQNYHAITMFNIFVRAYNNLTNDEKFEIFSSMRKNTDDLAESLLDDIDKIDKENDYSEKDGDK